MSIRTIESLGELRGRRVIVRCDLNVPLDGDRISDDGRIRASLTTLSRLSDAGARVVVISHLGRPEGVPDAASSLRPVAARLGELLGSDVAFSSDTIGAAAAEAVSTLTDGSVAVLENLRFDPRETTKDPAARAQFAEELARFGDALVSDGFGVVHRRHASVFELAELLPSAAGLLVEQELGVLERLTIDPARPFTVVLGGSKVSDKLAVIGALLPKVDRLLIGGGMLFTFLAARGDSVGASLLESDQVDAVNGYVEDAARRGVELILPTDVVVADSFSADAAHTVTASDRIESTEFGSAAIGLDIGPETAREFADAIGTSSTVFWNGPMGVFEFPAFAAGTRAVAEALSGLDGLGVVGGGDSAAAVRQLGFSDDDFGHISTGGGASLEFLEGKQLPGLEVLGWSA